MRSRVSRSLAVLTGLTVFASGCGDDDDPTGPQSELSQAEAMAVFSEILSAVFMVSPSADELAELPNGPAMAAETFTIDETAPCQGGGTIGLTGTFVFDVDESGSGIYSYDIVETPNACGVVTGSGETYRVNGAPNIQMAGSYSFAEGAPEGVFNMSFSGGMSWIATNGGTSGSCTIDLAYAFDWQNQNGSVQGSICGHSVDTTY